MLFGFFLVCTIALGLATVLLALAGQRLRAASRISGVLLAAMVYFSAGWIVSEVWGISAGPIDAAEVFCFGVSLVVIVLRPVWNAIGQVFMGTVAAAALAYLIFAGSITVDGNLSALGVAASAILFLLELFALCLSCSFAFETCDVICRVRHSRTFPEPDPGFRPK